MQARGEQEKGPFSPGFMKNPRLALKLRAKDVNTMCMDMACVILAGGRSTRMGRDKATTAFRGGTLIKRVYDTVKDIFPEILVVSSLHDTIDGVDAPIVKDIVPLQSPMVGIATGLIHSQRPGVFAVACDMPFLSVDAIRYVLAQAGNEDITIPKIGGYYEPLHAIYRRTCLAPFLRLIGLNLLKVAGVFPYVTAKAVDDHPCFHAGDFLVFSNINTLEALEMIETGGPR